MSITFFELQDWEEKTLKSSFPDAVFTPEKLTPENVGQYQNTQIAAIFIASRFNKEILDQLPNLKFIITRSTGFDHIDLQEAKARNILVSNIPEYGSRTVAEHTFALTLALTRKIYQSINQAKHFDFNHQNIRGIDLFGRTLGIIGLGKIGQEVAAIGKGFGMKVLVFTNHLDESLAKRLGFEYVPLEHLLQNADIISLHIPYNPKTHHLINKTNIQKLKQGAYLINTARGGLVETEAILQALEQGILAGVGLDVLEEEEELSEEAVILTANFQAKVDLKTLILNHILMDHPKVIITPHNAFNSQEALARILSTTIGNINAFLKGTPINLVA